MYLPENKIQNPSVSPTLKHILMSESASDTKTLPTSVQLMKNIPESGLIISMIKLWSVLEEYYI